MLILPCSTIVMGGFHLMWLMNYLAGFAGLLHYFLLCD